MPRSSSEEESGRETISSNFSGISVSIIGIILANRYWVGNGGAWEDDDNHWATVSGGSPGDGNLPTEDDNVYFDENSFTVSGETVTVYNNGVSSAFCRDMIWTTTTNPNLTFNNIPYDGYSRAYIDIHGNVVLASGMQCFQTTLTTGCQLNFSGNSTCYFTTNGVNVDINISTSETVVVIMLDDLNISGTSAWPGGIELNGNSTFDANDNDIYLQTIITYDSSSVNMGNGTWTFDNAYAPVGINIFETSTLNAEGSTVLFNLDYVGANDFVRPADIEGEVLITLNNVQIEGDGNQYVDFAYADEDLYFENLTISGAGRGIRFSRYNRYYVNDTLSINGSLGNVINLYMKEGSSSANTHFHLNAEKVILSYVAVKACYAGGTAIPFNATNNCTDNSYNTYWRFAPYSDNITWF